MANPAVKDGDVVHVRHTVKAAGGGTYILVEVPQAYENKHRASEALLAVSDIVHVEPRPLKVGDRVTAHHTGVPWEIIAIDDDVAWCKHAPGRRGFFDLSELTRAPNTCGND